MSDDLIKTFWVERTSEMIRHLRRYRRSENPCGAATPELRYYCDAMNYFDRIPIPYSKDGTIEIGEGVRSYEMDKTDPRWPTQCVRCNYQFDVRDEWQVFQEVIYVCPATGVEYNERSLPVGAVYDATWHNDWCFGADGRSITVQTPGGEWLIDGRASNCTLPEDRNHRCWVRHGDPVAGTLHVDKQGHTCSAGSGSIIMSGYHGYLHNGYLKRI